MKWSLLLAANYFIIYYKPDLKKKVPVVLFCYIDENSKDNEVQE